MDMDLMPVEQVAMDQDEVEIILEVKKFLFKPGDVIIPYSAPFVKILDPFFLGEKCNYCLKTALLGVALLPCATCRLMHYCNETCMRKDWTEVHQAECGSELFRKIWDEKDSTSAAHKFGRELRNVVCGILRSLAMYQVNPSTFSQLHDVYGSKKWSFNNLIIQSSRIIYQAHEIRTVDWLKEQLQKDSGYTYKRFRDNFFPALYGIWQRSMPIIEEGEKIGNGIYLPITSLSHSCRPCTTYVHDFDKVELRCIHPVIPGKEPTVYFYQAANGMYLNREQRKTLLHGRYNYTCSCVLCHREDLTGPRVDYPRLNQLRSMLLPGINTGIYNPALPRSLTFEAVLRIRQEGLSHLRKLYFEFDHRITRFCCFIMVMLHIVAYTRGQLPDETDTYRRYIFSVIDMQKRLQITYGTQTEIYKEFQKVICRLKDSIANGHVITLIP